MQPYSFLFTDIEGSTRLWAGAPDDTAVALAQHDALVPEVAALHGGRVFKALGDGFCICFDQTAGALAAAVDLQLRLAEAPVLVGETDRLRVRTAVHTGPVIERDGDYFGLALSEAARLRDVGHAGQILVSAAAEAALAEAGRPGTFRDLGPHRLRDLQRPIRVFQVVHPGLRAEFPPLRSLESYRQNLPIQVSSFVGREGEITQVRQLLGERRLVTLTGFGGVGKTRLALQVAAESLDGFEHGTWFVPLSSLAQGSLVAATLADVLGLSVSRDASPLDTLVGDLRHRHCLLVLDNCEHVVDAVAEVVGRLLRECPGVTVLATSRQSLRLAGELVWDVPRLATPRPEGGGSLPRLLDCASVRLFQERAAGVRRGFQVDEGSAAAVARICARLDGLPLALELAAARVRSFSPQQIAERLDDRFRLLTGGGATREPRQQALIACIEWSHDLLTGAEQRLFRRLAVFSGGFSLAAAEGICADDELDEYEVLDLVDSLVDRSLLVSEPYGVETRFRLLESLREYARGRLEAAGEAETLAARHASHFAEQAAGLRELLGGADQARCLDAIEADNDNFRAALAFFERSGASRAGDYVRLTANLWKFWYIRGHVREGLERARHAVSLLDGQEPIPAELQARALGAAANLACPLGRLAEAREWLERCLCLRLELGEAAGIAGAHNNLGLVAREAGDLDAARAHFRECRRLYAEAERPEGLAAATLNLAGIAQESEDLPEAEALYQESLRRHRALADPWGTMLTLHGLGDVRRRQGDPARARVLHAEALDIAIQLGAQTNIPGLVTSLAVATCQMGQLQDAAVQLAAAEVLREKTGAALSPADLAEFAACADLLRGSLHMDELVLLQREGRRLALEHELNILITAQAAVAG